MAFGSWLKGIYGKAKDLITTYAPVVKKVLGVVAPVLGKLGGVLGGTAGSVLSKIGSYGTTWATASQEPFRRTPQAKVTFDDAAFSGSGAVGANIAPRFKH